MSMLTSILLAIVLRHSWISCQTAPVKHYSGESQKVVNILQDMQTEASYHDPYHHHSHGRHLDFAPVSHEGHSSGHNNWDNIDKIWETGSGAHHSDYDKYGNHGHNRHFVDIGDGYHDRHNDGLNAGKYEGYDDRSLWARDRGQDHERNTKWDRELEEFAHFVHNVVKKANAGKSDHLSKYHNVDNGAHYGLKHIDDNSYDIFAGRGRYDHLFESALIVIVLGIRHSGHGWHELDGYRGNKGHHSHGSDYRDHHLPIPHAFH